MKKSFLLLLLSVFFAVSAGEKYTQEYLDKQAKLITAEANELYLLEKAAWLGTDIFLEKFSAQSERVGGYVTYFSGSNTVTLVFYSKDPLPETVAVFSFDTASGLKNVKTDSKERKLTKYENELRMIRESVYNEMKDAAFYSFYKNTSPNIIPIIKNNEKKVRMSV